MNAQNIASNIMPRADGQESVLGGIGDTVSNGVTNVRNAALNELDKGVKAVNNFGMQMFGIDADTDKDKGINATAMDKMASDSLAKFENRYSKSGLNLPYAQSGQETLAQYGG
jgi:hypothetical protein